MEHCRQFAKSVLRLRQQDPKGTKARSDQPARSPSAAGTIFRSKGRLGLSIKTGEVWPSHNGGQAILGCPEACRMTWCCIALVTVRNRNVPGHEKPICGDEGDGPRRSSNNHEVSAPGHRRNCARCQSTSAIVDTKWTQSAGRGSVETAKCLKRW